VITAHNSPSLAQNPVKPRQLVVVDRVDRPDYNATVHVSGDTGRTWQDSGLVRPANSTSKLFAAHRRVRRSRRSLRAVRDAQRSGQRT